MFTPHRQRVSSTSLMALGQLRMLVVLFAFLCAVVGPTTGRAQQQALPGSSSQDEPAAEAGTAQDVTSQTFYFLRWCYWDLSTTAALVYWCYYQAPNNSWYAYTQGGDAAWVLNPVAGIWNQYTDYRNSQGYWATTGDSEYYLIKAGPANSPSVYAAKKIIGADGSIFVWHYNAQRWIVPVANIGWMTWDDYAEARKYVAVQIVNNNSVIGGPSPWSLHQAKYNDNLKFVEDVLFLEPGVSSLEQAGTSTPSDRRPATDNELQQGDPPPPPPPGDLPPPPPPPVDIPPPPPAADPAPTSFSVLLPFVMAP